MADFLFLRQVLCITSSITFISQFRKKSTSDRKAQVIDKRSPELATHSNCDRLYEDRLLMRSR
ncbi:MAG: hypothetical protein PT118_09650 [Aphanizomenon gracile PMC644.10]|nr:hypothetical protein [Aphanizomenon gracile PMC638.10]MDM3848587.1 hypothetical protein [Aphanizomenon gracile PMC627.10]MDM3860085.1 hypothetical protein [Aphanizomenon gracile PMC644.10]